VKKKITKKTKGIIPVHLYGNPCDMDSIMALAKEHNLFVVEDAAECHGATYHGKKAGSFGDVGTFSFFGNKIITSGEGGMVITNNSELAAKMMHFKSQGMDLEKRYWFTSIGYNYRMTNIEAAIGYAQFENIEQHIADHRKVAQWYIDEFEKVKDYISFQKVTDGAESVWWMFSIVLNDNCKINRDDLMQKLNEDGIETRPLFYPMHIMPPYFDENAKCPMSEYVSSRGINLPTHAFLEKEDVQYICDRIKIYIAG